LKIVGNIGPGQDCYALEYLFGIGGQEHHFFVVLIEQILSQLQRELSFTGRRLTDDGNEKWFIHS